jgi:hypothetical protein
LTLFETFLHKIDDFLRMTRSKILLFACIVGESGVECAPKFRNKYWVDLPFCTENTAIYVMYT